ncbi:MAG: urease accessory protein UreE [Proteobacteria bacterium]|nr:urease accessory protein UreE [Pseudomonadota bacterium]
MLVITAILGSARDPAFAGPLHAVSHAGGLEYLEVTLRDAQRRRYRGKTDCGTDCALTLPRDIRLGNGDVLLLETDRAIVVRVDVERWLRLRPRDAEVALRLGYHAGNLHWRVRFAEGDLLIMLEGPREDYLARLEDFLRNEEIEVGNDA